MDIRIQINPNTNPGSLLFLILALAEVCTLDRTSVISKIQNVGSHRFSKRRRLYVLSKMVSVIFAVLEVSFWALTTVVKLPWTGIHGERVWGVVAYPGVRDNRSTINTKTGYDDDDDDVQTFLSPVHTAGDTRSTLLKVDKVDRVALAPYTPATKLNVSATLLKLHEY